MKVVVIGGTGLIGSKLIKKLKSSGHEAIAASPSTGVNTITGEGLAKVLENADVVVDVANAPSFEDKSVLEFFETSGRNILAAEKTAGVRYHVALSVVGADRLPDSGYMIAKSAQEKLIKASGIPYTIVRATQFFEFLGSIADGGTTGDAIHLPKAFLQPIAAEDVAALLFDVVLEKSLNGILDIAGPDRLSFATTVGQYLRAINDQRFIVSSEDATYFGSKLSEGSLVPAGNARLGTIDFEKWFESSALKPRG